MCKNVFLFSVMAVRLLLLIRELFCVLFTVGWCLGAFVFGRRGFDWYFLVG